jgi:hypothetical protein
VWHFFHRPTDEEMVSILRRQDVDYVMVHKKSRLDERLADLPFFLATDSPGQTYSFYVVDHAKLAEYPDGG